MNRDKQVSLHINGQPLRMAAGTSVAAALRVAQATPPVAHMGVARRSVLGEARAPFCGMGICQECRVNIDGRRRLACQTCCADGMVVETTS